MEGRACIQVLTYLEVLFDARVVRALRDSYAVFTGVAKMALASLVGFGMMGLLFGLGAVMTRKFQAYTNCAEYSHG